jgi:hypothetical protein
MKGNGTKIGFIVAFLAMSVYYLWPSIANMLEQNYIDDLPEAERTEYVEDNAQRLQNLREESLSLGLDLQGGMHVTLEVGTPQLILELAGDYADETLEEVINTADQRALENNTDFIEELVAVFEEQYPDARLSRYYRSDAQDITRRSSNDEIEEILKRTKLDYKKCDSIAKEVAKLISDNAIVGWFQGRMEVGARALGGRSILANPLNPDARDHVNKHVKNREAWRPFCPSLQFEAFKEYFDTNIDSSNYMIIACDIDKSYLETLPSCIHIDGTVRPQTVKKDANPVYWEMLEEFKKITGHPIVVNTSFNVQGEPIVMKPEDAIRCFYGSGMDALAIGSFLIEKS